VALQDLMLDLQVQGWVYSWDPHRWVAVILLDRPQDLQAQALAWDSAPCQESYPVPVDHLSCSAVLVLSPFILSYVLFTVGQNG
jgi:hypothetical protein